MSTSCRLLWSVIGQRQALRAPSWSATSDVYKGKAPALLLTLCVRRWLLAKLAIKAAAAVEGDSNGATGGWDDMDGVRWTRRSSAVYPVLCSAAGVVAGLFGVGAYACRVCMLCVCACVILTGQQSVAAHSAHTSLPLLLL